MLVDPSLIDLVFEMKPDDIKPWRNLSAARE